MHNRKTKRLLWIIGFLVLLILTVSVSYVLGSQKQEQNNAKSAQTVKSNESVSSPKSTNSNKSTNNSNTSSKVSSIPSQFCGTWYEGSQKFAVISVNKFVLDSDGTTITKNSLPLQLCDDRGPNGTYEIYHNPNPNASGAEGGDGNAYWIGNLTINGQKERVLACHTRMRWFAIYTSHPTSKNQGIQYDANDYQDQIGNPNLDFLKGKSRTDLDHQNQSSKQDNNKQTDSNKDANKNNSSDDQSNKSDDSSDNNNNDNSNSNSNNDKQDNSNQNNDN